MKKLLYLITIFIILIQSCNKDGFKSRYTKAYGTVTDSETGEPLSEVKLEIKKMIFETSGYTLEETGQYTYTDQNGYYEFKFKNLEGFNVIVPEKEGYVFILFNSNYPQIPTGMKTEINIELTKIGPAIVEGKVTDNFNNLLNNVKLSILRRPKNDNTSYPISIDTVTYSDIDGLYHIEYREEEDYNYFIKPEKDGYYYELWGEDYCYLNKYIQGNVIIRNFEMIIE